MRPVRLDLDGFASFREPTHLDLNDIGYFALVGNTGAGKSTLIDAICFALYGTAPRWEHKSSVANALAPTSNRAVVSLIFDIGGQRYQVAREVRRSPAGQVNTKNARLERFLDPTACPGPTDPPAETDVLASETSQVTPAVQDLLGLNFDDFCHCVVLPQGQFADFLKASSSDRQKILLRILGAEHYDAIKVNAGARGRDLRQQIATHEGHLESLTQATPQALAAATARQDQLTALSAQVPDLLGPLTTAADRFDHAVQEATAAHRAQTVLEGVKVPDGLLERDATLTRANLNAYAATQHLHAAQQTFETAAAAAAAGPQRRDLERIETAYAQRDQRTQEHAQAEVELTGAAAAQVETAAGARRAKVTEDTARIEKESSDHAHQQAVGALDQITTRLIRLEAITAPGSLPDDAATSRAAQAKYHQTAQAAREATEAHDTIVARHASLPSTADLDELGEGLDVARHQLEDWAIARRATLTARDVLTATADAATSAERTAQQAIDRVSDLTAAAHVAVLRPGLVQGHDCPVCEQTVTTVPAPAEIGPDLDAARSSADTAARDSSTAQAELQAADRAVHLADQTATDSARRLGDTLTRVLTQAGRLATRAGLDPTGQTRLTDPSTTIASRESSGEGRAAEAEASLSAAASLLQATQRACTEATDQELILRRTLDEATAARDAATATGETIVTGLRRAHRSLVLAHAAAEELSQSNLGIGDTGAEQVCFEPPALPESPTEDPTDVDGLVAGWAALGAWAQEQAAQLRRGSLPVAITTRETADLRRRSAATALEEATDQTAATSRAASAAAVTAAEARARVENLGARITELTAELDNAPARDQIPSLLDEADQLTADHLAAKTTTAAALAARDQTETNAAAAAAAVTADRDALAQTRDQVAPWSPPAFTSTRLSDDLAGCWADLSAWAATAAAIQNDIAVRADAAAAEHEATREAATTRLVETFISHDLDGAAVGMHPRRAETLAEVALTEATAQARTISDDLTRATKTRVAITTATKKAQVAEQLASMMRSGKFPEWLAGAALDTMVVGASSSLRQLSDGQFSLIHSGGDFHVIDHFDADSTRSVKTLSGGETFQASLALALSLSDQLATLAAGGTSKIESIFLDEGFGTLDPESLDMVAATLENLAGGDRLVGIVTHVAALADRTPHRFRVTNNQQTSKVTLETAS